MVLITIKSGNDPQFLFDVPAKTEIEKVREQVRLIYNARLKVERIATEIDQLAQYGTILPDNMQGLNEDQIIDLKLKDPWTENCVPSGGAIENKDIYNRRNGQRPNDSMVKILQDTITKSKESISKKKIDEKVALSLEMVQESIDNMKGACMIVYPMGLPPHDPIQAEFENREDLSGQQASKLVIPEFQCAIWWASKELQDGKLLSDYVGRNDRTKIVAKIQKIGQSAPAREAVVSEAQQKEMMAKAYRRQEELKKLEENSEDDYLHSAWADSNQLKRHLTGMGDIKWGPR